MNSLNEETDDGWTLPNLWEKYKEFITLIEQDEEGSLFTINKLKEMDFVSRKEPNVTYFSLTNNNYNLFKSSLEY